MSYLLILLTSIFGSDSEIKPTDTKKGVIIESQKPEYQLRRGGGLLPPDIDIEN